MAIFTKPTEMEILELVLFHSGHSDFKFLNKTADSSSPNAIQTGQSAEEDVEQAKEGGM